MGADVSEEKTPLNTLIQLWEWDDHGDDEDWQEEKPDNVEATMWSVGFNADETQHMVALAKTYAWMEGRFVDKTRISKRPPELRAQWRIDPETMGLIPVPIEGSSDEDKNSPDEPDPAGDPLNGRYGHEC